MSWSEPPSQEPYCSCVWLIKNHHFVKTICLLKIEWKWNRIFYCKRFWGRDNFIYFYHPAGRVRREWVSIPIQIPAMITKTIIDSLPHLSLSQLCTHMCTHTHTKKTQTLTHTQSRTHSHKNTQTLTHTHARTHTHIWVSSLSTHWYAGTLLHSHA